MEVGVGAVPYMDCSGLKHNSFFNLHIFRRLALEANLKGGEMTVQELIDKLELYKDKNIEVEFVLGASSKQKYTRARFMEFMIVKNLKLDPVRGSLRACIQLYP